jgi:hypothetical protein
MLRWLEIFRKPTGALELFKMKFKSWFSIVDDQRRSAVKSCRKSIPTSSQQVRTLAGRSAQGANGRDSHDRKPKRKSAVLRTLPIKGKK